MLNSTIMHATPTRNIPEAPELGTPHYNGLVPNGVCYRGVPLYSFSIWLTIIHHHVLQWVDDLADAGANQYNFHLEATSRLNSLIPRSSDVVPRSGFHGLQEN